MLLSYLLNAQPLQTSEAAGCQLVSIVTNTQLTITIIAPAINLDKQKMILFNLSSDFSLGYLILGFHMRPYSPLHSRSRPWRRSVHRWCPLKSYPAGSRWLSWGRAGWLSSLNQSGHSYYNPMQRPGGGQGGRSEPGMQNWNDYFMFLPGLQLLITFIGD